MSTCKRCRSVRQMRYRLTKVIDQQIAVLLELHKLKRMTQRRPFASRKLSLHQLLPPHLLDLVYSMVKGQPCSICLDSIDTMQELALTRCGHHFHQTCLRKCTTKTCPICRRSLT